MYFLILLLAIVAQVLGVALPYYPENVFDTPTIRNFPRQDNTTTAPINTTTPANGTTRSVYLIENIYVSGPTVYSPTYDHIVLAVHCAIEFSPLGSDGAVRIEVIVPVEGQYSVRVVDVGNFDDYINPFGFLNGYVDQEVALIGNVSLTNAQIINPDTGEGLVNNAWGTDRSYRSDGHNSVDLAQAIARILSLPIPADFQTTFAEAKKYTQGRGLNIVNDAVTLDFVKFTAAGRNSPVVKEFNFGSGTTLTAAASQKIPTEKLVSAPADTDPTTPFNSQRIVGHPDDPNAACGGASRLYPSNQSALPARDLTDDPCRQKPNATVAKLRLGGTTKDVAAARIKGELKLVTALIEDVVKFSGIAALIASPTLIILDLVNGQFKAAAFGAIGFAVGIAIDLLISGPIGWLVAAAVTAFFAILPGLFKQVKTPKSNNVAQIVQWSFFGDATHTGNEKCNKNLTDHGQPANCTAVYGPGVIASTLKWEMFDAIAFMIEKNQGHAMSILDIANGLFPIDYSTSDNGSGAVATVDCGKYYADAKRSLVGRALDRILPRQWAQIYHPRPKQTTPSPLSAGYDCERPVYKLKRELVKIPVLNLTAAQVYPRIVGPNGGDCKLLSDAAEPLNLPGYNMRLTGRPAAIACNITNANGAGNALVNAPNQIPTVTGPDGGAGTPNPSASSSSAGPNATTGPSTNASIVMNVTGGYNFFSCNTDSEQSRTIGPQLTVQDTMTSESCAKNCKGLAYFGLEFGNQCFCGDYVAPGGNVTKPEECLSPCKGNATQACGGENRVLVYEYSGSSYVSGPNTTSDGSVGRGQVRAPQPPPGFPELTAANTVCLVWSSSRRCFPSGDYDLQRGEMGFKMTDAKDMIGPVDSKINIPTVSTTGGRPAFQVVKRDYPANQTGSKTFQDALGRCLDVGDGTGFKVNATDDSVVAVCLFTKPNYKGGVICFGKGGGNLTADYQNKAQSIKVHGGAYAWIYPIAYDDNAGQSINGDIADLKNVAFGTSGSMTNQIKALWVEDSKPGKIKRQESWENDRPNQGPLSRRQQAWRNEKPAILVK